METTVAPRGRYFTLAELYEHTECSMVEAVTLEDGRLMWFDEEGKFASPPKPVNMAATMLLAQAGGVPGDFVVGPVLIERGETD